MFIRVYIPQFMDIDKDGGETDLTLLEEASPWRPLPSSGKRPLSKVRGSQKVLSSKLPAELTSLKVPKTLAKPVKVTPVTKSTLGKRKKSEQKQNEEDNSPVLNKKPERVPESLTVSSEAAGEVASGHDSELKRGKKRPRRQGDVGTES